MLVLFSGSLLLPSLSAPAIVKYEPPTIEQNEQPLEVIVEAHTPLEELFYKEFGVNAHKMLEIARCESGLQQFEKDGTALLSRLGTPDYGLLQINKIWHADAEKMKLDIFNSIEDHLKMGSYILKKQGVGAWSASFHCHKVDVIV